MIFGLLAASSLAAATPAAAPAPPVTNATILKDASRAIEAGRLQEAKLIIGRAVAAGISGIPIERLIADLAFASHKYAEALSAYKKLAGSPARRASDCENGAVAALELGSAEDAKPLVECAVEPRDASWRAWNARGVLADLTRDWAAADEAYARAHRLAPTEARIVNNQGWSMLLRGEWAAGIPFFEQAATLDGKSERTANNLELANAALAADLPQRRAGESDREWAARLNDAGVAAELLGEKRRAIAAFTRALEASPTWYGRASNNLEAVSGN
jgi:tetratricopeptide (TPR) repeat protein